MTPKLGCNGRRTRRDPGGPSGAPGSRLARARRPRPRPWARPTRASRPLPTRPAYMSWRNKRMADDAFIENRTFDEIRIGDTASVSRTLSEKDIQLFRSEERRVGKEGVSTLSSGWWPIAEKKKRSDKRNKK